MWKQTSSMAPHLYLKLCKCLLDEWIIMNDPHSPLPLCFFDPHSPATELLITSAKICMRKKRMTFLVSSENSAFKYCVLWPCYDYYDYTHFHCGDTQGFFGFVLFVLFSLISKEFRIHIIFPSWVCFPLRTEFGPWYWICQFRSLIVLNLVFYFFTVQIALHAELNL